MVITESKIITCGPQNDFQLPIDPNHKHTIDHKVVTVNQMIKWEIYLESTCILYKLQNYYHCNSILKILSMQHFIKIQYNTNCDPCMLSRNCITKIQIGT